MIKSMCEYIYDCIFIHSFQFYTIYLETITPCHELTIPMILIWHAENL